MTECGILLLFSLALTGAREGPTALGRRITPYGALLAACYPWLLPLWHFTASAE